MSVLIKKTLEPFSKYFKIKGLIEVIVNQSGEVITETAKGWKYHKDSAITQSALSHMATILASVSGQKFDDENPLLATHIPEYGYRIQIVGAGLCDSGIALSIRVGTSQVFDIDSYMNKDSAAKLIQSVKKGKNILIVGGTGTGKTTFINSLVVHIQDDQRLLTVEDTKELIIPHRNVLRLVKSKSGTDIGSVSYSDIINACVRFRPDRIILGEIAIDSTLPFFRLLNTGHGGTMATLHADDADKAIDALILNARLAGAGGDKEDIREYCTKTLDVIVQIHVEKGRKFIAEAKYL